MKLIFEILKFLLYITIMYYFFSALSFVLIWFSGIVYTTHWFWSIWLGMGGYFILAYFNLGLFVFLSPYLKKLNSFEKLGNWVVIALGIIFGIITIILPWTAYPLSEFKSYPICIGTNLATIFTVIFILIGLINKV